MKNSTTPLRVPQILGGRPSVSSSNASSGGNIVSAKDLNYVPTFPCSADLQRFLEILSTQKPRDNRGKVGGKRSVRGFELFHSAVQSGCPGCLIIRPGQCVRCQIYCVNFVYRQAVVLVGPNISILPLSLLRIHSYASLNGVFSSLYYEYVRERMSSYDLDVYNSFCSSNPIEVPIQIPWRNDYVTPLVSLEEGENVDENVDRNKFFAHRLDELIDIEYSRFEAKRRSNAEFLPQIDIQRLKSEFHNELIRSMTGVVSLQRDEFTLTNSCFFDVMLPTTYSLFQYADLEASDAASYTQLTSSAVENSEMRSLASLYKFLIAKDLIHDALEANVIGKQNQFDHLRFYSRLTLQEEGSVRRFINNFNDFNNNFNDVTLWCKRQFVSKRFQDLHRSLLTCPKFDPELNRLNTKVMSIIDQSFGFFTPLPSNFEMFTEDHLADAVSSILNMFESDFYIEKKVISNLQSELQALLDLRIIMCTQPVDSTAPLIVPPSLDSFLQKHLPEVHPLIVSTEQANDIPIGSFSSLLMTKTIAERCYLARCYFIETLLPLLFVYSVSSLLRKHLLELFADVITPLCLADATFPSDFVDGLRLFRSTLLADFNETHDKRHIRLSEYNFPSVIVNTALSILASEDRGLSSSALLAAAFDHVWPRFLRILVEQGRALIDLHLFAMHTDWITFLLKDLSPFASLLASEDSDLNGIGDFSSIGAQKNCKERLSSSGFTAESTLSQSFSSTRANLLNLGLSPYVTESSIFSFASIVLIPYLWFDPASSEQATIYYVHNPRDCLTRKMNCLLLSDGYSMPCSFNTDILRALLPFFKRVLRADGDAFTNAALQDALLLKPDQEVAQFFMEWLNIKRNRINNSVEIGASVQVPKTLPPLPKYPSSNLSNISNIFKSTPLDSAVPMKILNSMDAGDDPTNSTPIKSISIGILNDVDSLDFQLVSLFTLFTTQLAAILSRYTSFSDVFKVYSTMMSSDLMRERLSDATILDKISAEAYSLPPECLLKRRTVEGELANGSSDPFVAHVFNPYSSLNEDNTKTSSDSQNPFSMIEHTVQSYVGAILTETANKSTQILSEASSNVEFLILIVYIAAELVKTLDRHVLEAYTIPSYLSLGFVSVGLVDFKILLVTTLSTIRQDIQQTICGLVECLADHMSNLMKSTETMLGATTANLDKLSHILTTMESHKSFMQQWTSVACYFCSLSLPISKLKCSYLLTGMSDIRKSIAHVIPIIYGSINCLGTDDKDFVTSSINTSVALRINKLLEHPTTAPDAALIQQDDLCPTLQAVVLLCRVNHAQNTARFNYKRHIRVFSRLLLIFSDWLSKIVSTLHAISSEILKMQSFDFSLATTDPLQFRKSFPAFCKDFEIPYLETMYTSFEGNDVLLVTEFIKILQAYTCIRISINSEVVNGLTAEDVHKLSQLETGRTTEENDRNISPVSHHFNTYQASMAEDTGSVDNKKPRRHRIGWKIPHSTYRWPYQYTRPCLDRLKPSAEPAAAHPKTVSAINKHLSCLLITDYDIQGSDRCELLALRDDNGLLSAAGYSAGHLYEDQRPQFQRTAADEQDARCSSCYDLFHMFMELYLLIEEIKNLHVHAYGWSKALSIDLHLVDSPKDIETTLLPLCLLTTSFIKLQQLYQASLSKPLIDIDTSVFVRLLEICANSISLIRSSCVYSNWNSTADYVEEYLKEINPRIFFLHFLASPDAVEEDLANFGEGTGLNAFLRGISSSESTPIEMYFDPDRTILVEHLLLYDRIETIFDAASALYTRGLINKQAMITLRKIDNWIETLSFQAIKLDSPHRAEGILSTLYNFWDSLDKDEFADILTAEKLGPVFGGKSVNLTATLRRVRTLMLARDRILNTSNDKLPSIEQITVSESATQSILTSSLTSSQESSINEHEEVQEKAPTMQNLPLNTASLTGSTIFETPWMPNKGTSFATSFTHLLRHGNVSTHSLVDEPSFHVPIISCTKKHIDDIHEAMFVVAYVLFNDYSPSTQTVARRFELELVFLQTFALNVYRATIIIPELLLILPDLRDISKGTAPPNLRDAFPPTQDPLLETISLFNIMRKLHTLCLGTDNDQQFSSLIAGEDKDHTSADLGAFSLVIPAGSLRTIIRQHPTLVRSLSIHVAQASAILHTFHSTVLKIPPIPTLHGQLAFDYINVPNIIRTYYAQSQQYIIDILRHCPLVRCAILYNNTCTSMSAMLPSGQLKPIVFRTSQTALSNSIYDIMMMQSGINQTLNLQITGICSGYERLHFGKPISMPNNILYLGTSIFSPKVHQTAMFKEYIRALRFLVEERYTELISRCLYQCVQYAISTLVFMYLDGSPGNLLTLYYELFPKLKRAIATVAVSIEDTKTTNLLTSCYSIWNYKDDRRLYIQALLARIYEHEKILTIILEDSLTFYIMKTVPHLSQAAIVEKAKSFLLDRSQTQAALNELYTDPKGALNSMAMVCGIHPGAHTHHIASTLPYALPSNNVFASLNATQRRQELEKAIDDISEANIDIPRTLSKKGSYLFAVSCSEAVVPLVGQYMGKASLLDCIPLNYKQLQAVSQLGIGMQNRIPTFLVGDVIRSYNNPDYLIIIHALCRYFGMRYEFIFCSPSTNSDILIHSLCTKILAGYYVVICGVEFLTEAQLNNLSNMLSNHHTGTGTISSLVSEKGVPFSFSSIVSGATHNTFMGGYTICLPEAVYEGAEFTLTTRGNQLKKLFPMHQFIEVLNFGMIIPNSLVVQAKSLVCNLCSEVPESDEKPLTRSTTKETIIRCKQLTTEQRIARLLDKNNFAKEYYAGTGENFAIVVPNFDLLYPHFDARYQRTSNPYGHLFMQKSAQYGAKLYELSMFLNTLEYSTPQLRPDDLDLILRRCKDANNSISVATTLSTFLLSQTALFSIRDVVARVITAVFALPQQQQTTLKSVIGLLNILHGTQETDDEDFWQLFSRKGADDTDQNITSKNIGKVWKTLKQMYTPAYIDLCESIAQKSTVLEPIGVDFLILCLDMLTLGPVFLLPPLSSSLQSAHSGNVAISQLCNRYITSKALKSGVLSKVTQRQTHFQFLIVFAQLIAKIGKMRPFFIHSLTDLHENIQSIIHLGAQALLIFICNPPNGTMARSMLSVVTSLQSYYPVLELQHNIKAKFDFYNKPKCLLLTTVYEDAGIIQSNFACVQRRLVVIPEYLKFNAMFNAYISRYMHLSEDGVLVDRARQFFTVTSLMNMKSVTLASQYLQSLCMRRTTQELRGECLAEKRLQLGGKLFGIFISYLTDEMMHNIFCIVPNPIIWTLYRQLLIMYLTMFELIRLKPRHPEAHATFKESSTSADTQKQDMAAYLSLHSINSSIPLSGYDSDMQLQSLSRAAFFSIDFSIGYLWAFVYEASSNAHVIFNLFLPIYAAIFNALHVLYIFYFKKPLKRLKKIYKKSLLAFVYHPERFVQKTLAALESLTHIVVRADLDAAVTMLSSAFPEQYADEDGILSAYSYLGMAHQDGSFFRFTAEDKDSKLMINHFPYACSVGLFKNTMFEDLFHRHAVLQHELVLMFDCERVMFTVYLAAFVMSKLPVCLIGEAFSGKTTYLMAVEALLRAYIRKEHVAIFDTDSFEQVIHKLMHSCYIHTVQTNYVPPSQASSTTSNMNTSHAGGTTSHPLSFRKIDPNAISTIGCPISILDVVEDDILLTETEQGQGVILDTPDQKLPLYHITIANLSTNTVDDELQDDLLSNNGTLEDNKVFALEALVNSTQTSQPPLQKDQLSTFFGEKYIICDNLEASTTCILTGVLGTRFSSGVFAPNLSLVVETSYLHDFLLASQINFVLPPSNNTRDFLLLLLKRNFQHPSLSELESFAPKVAQGYTSANTRWTSESEKTYDCNLYVGIQKPEVEFLHEYSDSYFLQFIEGMLLIEDLLPVSILRVISEIKRIQQYTTTASLTDVQLNTVTLGSLVGAFRNIPAIKHIHMSKIMDELASAVTIGRLSPHGPFGPMNPENMTRYLRTNTLLASGLYSGIQTFPSWEIQVLGAAFKESPFNKGVVLVEASQAFAGLRTLAEDDYQAANDYNFKEFNQSNDLDGESLGNRYRHLITALNNTKPYYMKLFFYNPHSFGVNKCVFDVHFSMTKEHLLDTIDPTILNRTFVFLTDISVLMERNSLEVFGYIKYLRNPGLFSKCHSNEEVMRMQSLTLRVPIFLMSQSEMPGSFYSSFLHAVQAMGNYRISNRKTFMKIAEQAFSLDIPSNASDTDSYNSSNSYSYSGTSSAMSVSVWSHSDCSSAALEFTRKNPELRAFLSLIDEPTEAAIKRRQRILIDVQVMLQSITTQSSEAPETDDNQEIRDDRLDSEPAVMQKRLGAMKDPITELTNLLVSVLNSQTEAVASFYIIRAAVLMALGINPLMALRDFTPTLSIHICDKYSSISPDYLLRNVNRASLGVNVDEYTELFLTTPTDIMVTIPMSLFNALLNKSAVIGVLSMIEAGSSLLSLFTEGETRILGALLAKYLYLPTMLSGREIILLLSRSFSLIVFADTSIIRPLPLRELPIIRHTIDENDMISSLQTNGDANVIANAFSTSNTTTPSLQLIRTIPHFILSTVPYNFNAQPFIARHEGSDTPIHNAYSDMYCEVFCRTTLYVYNCCMQNVINAIPYSLARFSEIASYYTTEIINKYLRILMNIQKLLSTITLLDNGIRNELFAPAIRNNIIYMRDQLVSAKQKLKLDFVRAVVMLQNACCDGPLITARLLFYPFTISSWGNCIQFEIGLFECLKNRKITNNSLNVSYTDNSTTMLQSLFNLSSSDEILHQTDIFSNYGLPSRLLMLCEDLMVPKWKTQLISSLCNPDPEIVQEIILLIQYVRLGFKFLFTTADLARIVIPACEVYFLEVELDRCKTRLSSMGVNVSSLLDHYRTTGILPMIPGMALDAELNATDQLVPDKNLEVGKDGKPRIIGQYYKRLKTVLEKITSLRHQVVSQKGPSSEKSVFGSSNSYDYRAVHRDLIIYLDCHMPPPIFEALLKHALVQDKPLAFMNFGSMAAPFQNILIVMKLVLLVESRMTKKNTKVFITTTFSVYVIKPLHDYRIYYIMAANVPFTFLLEIGFIGIRNCDITTLNAPKFQFKSNSFNLLKMQNPSVTEHELRYKLREISQKYSSFYSLYTNGFDDLEIIHRESCLEGSERLQKHIENIADHIEKYIFSRKEIMSRLIKREESNNVFIHLQQASSDTDGLDFDKMNFWCSGIARQIDYRREIAEKIAESSTVSDYAKCFGKAIASVLLLLRQMSMVHPSVVTAFTDYFFATYPQYLEERVGSNPSRSFTAIINSAHFILENTILLLPESMRTTYLMLFISIYQVCFNLARPEDLVHLKTMLANSVNFYILHFSDKFNTHLPLYNQARQIVAACPASFRCSPNVVYSWKIFSLLVIYNTQRFNDWYDYFIRNKAVFTLLNFAGDAYKMIIGTYLYKERALCSDEKEKNLGFGVTMTGEASNTNVVQPENTHSKEIDLKELIAQEAEKDISGTLATVHVPIIPPFVHQELEHYSTRSAPLPPSLQYPSLENTWAALLLIISLRQDLIPGTMDFFCRITPPSAIHDFLQKEYALQATARDSWSVNQNESNLLTTDIFSRIVIATAKAMGREIDVTNIGSQKSADEKKIGINGGKQKVSETTSPDASDDLGSVDLSTINPANLDQVDALLKHLQKKHSYELTRPAPSGYGSRIVLLYYDEGVAILPCLRAVFTNELVPVYGFPEYASQPVPTAECLASNVLFIDTQYNPCYSLSHLVNLYNSGARPAHLAYVLVPLPCCQKFGIESGAGTNNNLGIHLAAFIETCKPVQLYIQRPANFFEGLRHAVSIMHSHKSFRLKARSVYESTMIKALTLLALRYAILISERSFKVDDNESILLYMHLISQIESLPHINRARRLFFKHKIDTPIYTTTTVMMHSTLSLSLSNLNIRHVQAGLYTPIYYKSTAMMLGINAKMWAGVTISYLNNKLVNSNAFYEEAADQESAGYAEIDVAISSTNNSETELSNSRSVFSQHDYSFDTASMVSAKSEYLHGDPDQLSHNGEYSEMKLSTQVSDDLNSTAVLNTSGPDRFESYTHVELQRLLSTRRHLKALHISPRLQTLLHLPEMMTEADLITLLQRVQAITLELEKFATQNKNITEIIHNEDLQEALADTLQPIRFLKPELSGRLGALRDCFSLFLSNNVICYLTSQLMNNSVYSTAEVERAERTLPSNFYSVLLLSRRYSGIRKLTHSFTETSCVEQLCPIKVLSSTLWTVRGDIYQPIMNDILKWFKFQMCLRNNLDVECYTIVFTILDPTHYKDYFIRYDANNNIQCSKIENKRHKRKQTMPLSSIKVSNMKLYGIGYDYILNTIIDASHETWNFSTDCDIYAMIVPCELPSSVTPVNPTKVKDSYTLIMQALNYSLSPNPDDEIADDDQDFGVDHCYENSFQYVKIPVDFPGCWHLILQNKTSLTEHDIEMKSPYCGVGYF